MRDASEFGHVCVQPDTGYTNIANMEGQPSRSEDCLYLNVWTPAEDARDRLPVMVYFYGGAFTDGGGFFCFFESSTPCLAFENSSRR